MKLPKCLTPKCLKMISYNKWAAWFILSIIWIMINMSILMSRELEHVISSALFNNQVVLSIINMLFSLYEGTKQYK